MIIAHYTYPENREGRGVIFLEKGQTIYEGIEKLPKGEECIRRELTVQRLPGDLSIEEAGLIPLTLYTAPSPITY